MIAYPQRKRKAGSTVPQVRLVVLGAAIGLVFLVMAVRLWTLQVVRGDHYRLQADLNRFRLVSTQGPRGVIYDRHGRLLVRNAPQLTVSVVPAFLPDDPAELGRVMGRLAEILSTTGASQTAAASQPASQAQMPWERPDPASTSLFAALLEGEQAPYRPVPVATNVSRQAALIIEEEHLDLPGVLIETEPVRYYLYGALTAHLLGYVGPIAAQQAEQYRAQGYDPNRHRVGLSGLERTFEGMLRGYDGRKYIEVDVAGREVRTVGEAAPAVPGHNLVLTLDLGLQEAMEKALKQALKQHYKKLGVAIAMNPQTGEILGLVSLPAYDDNLFTTGISAEQFRAFQEDEYRPLVNHAIAGQYPPGSTFKIVVAAAGLEEKVITADTRLTCRGILWLPNHYAPWDPTLSRPFYCWIHESGGAHGSLSLVSALAQSCDIYFYQLGGGFPNVFEGLGEDRIGYYAELFGLGQLSGLDLPGETAGLIPDRNWKRVNYRETWVTGDTYNMAIGQGYVLATPLQMLNATAAIANGGTLYRPQLVYAVTDGEGKVVQPFEPEVIRQVPVSPQNLALVREGMHNAVTWGTARGLTVPGVAVAGKTGTAEYFVDRNKDGQPDRDREGHLPTHAWFTAFAPYENPEIVLVVFIFGGGEGSAVAAPVAEEILRAYFEPEAATP